MTLKIYTQLIEIAILPIDVTKQLISKTEGNNKELIRKSKINHSPAFLEVKNLRIIRRYFPIFSELIFNVDKRRPKLGKRKADKPTISQITTVEKYLTCDRHYKA